MSWLRVLRNLCLGTLSRSRGRSRASCAGTNRTRRLHIECLESRALPSAVVFQAPDTNGVQQIFRIDPEALALPAVQLTSQGYNINPELNGDKIVFSSNRDGNYEIYMMDVGGTNLMRLTNDPGNDLDPTFNTQTQRVAWVSTRTGNNEIWAGTLTGSMLTDLANLSNNSASDIAPSFRHDGARIVFSSYRYGALDEIMVMDAQGYNQTRLTDNTRRDFAPAFSPDGSSITFTSERDGRRQIYVMNGNGDNEQNVSNSPYADQSSDFSLDGARIVFSSNRSGGSDIYSISALGGGVLQMTSGAAYDVNPSWGGTVSAVPPGQLQFSSPSYSANENTASASIAVSRTGGSNGVISINFSTTAGSATAGTDYTAVGGTLTWADGDTSTKSFAVPLVNDNQFEGNETITLTLSNPTGGATLGSPATATFTIVDDDPEPVVPASSMIVFESNRDGYRHIYRMDPDGSNVQQLTFGSVNDFIPEASEDGSTIVFASDRAHPGTGDLEIYRINWDGTSMTQLTNLPGQQYDPAISPDKRYVTFKSPGVGGGTDVLMLDMITSVVTNLTNSPGDDHFATWNYEGDKIVFMSNRDGNNEIYLGVFAGPNKTNFQQYRLTNDASSRDFYPDISYDGQSIAWTKVLNFGKPNENSEIYVADLVLNANGQYVLTNPHNVSNHGAADLVPYFDPADEKLSFTSSRDQASGEIYTMDVNGANVQRLTNNNAMDSYATWVEAPVLISISDASVIEPGNGTVTLVFTVSLSHASDQTVRVRYTTTDGSATAGADYEAATGIVTFSPGVTTQQISIVVFADAENESSESLFVDLYKPYHAVLADLWGLGTIAI